MRDAIIIALMCIAAVGVGAWLYLDGEQSTSRGNIPVTVVHSASFAGEITERKNYRITTAEEFEQLWRMVYPVEGPRMPTVDFALYEVLGVFDGTHASGGYSVQVLSVQEDNARRITIVHTAPDDSCITTAAIESPFVLIMLPRSDLPIVREDIYKVRSCE